MSSPDEATRWFDRYGVSDILRVADPDQKLYREFGLEQATLGQLMHPAVLWPWFRAAVLEGHGVGAAGPHWRQLTGVFVVHRGRILASIRHGNTTAHTDYVALVRGLKLR
jgi:hypothetical protein